MEINFMEEYFKMKIGYEKRIKELEEEIAILKSSSTLIPKTLQITEEDIVKIKFLRTQGNSYAQIAKQTKWSKATVSRVLNGLYDDIF